MKLEIKTPFLKNFAETLVDIFSCLFRDDIDLVRFACRRLRQVIDECMSTVCLRHIADARLAGNTWKDPSSFAISISRKLPKFTQKDIRKKVASSGAGSARITQNADEEKAVEFLLIRLKSAVVTNCLTISRVVLNHKFSEKTAEIGYSVFVNNPVVDSVNASPETLLKLIARCFGAVRAAQLTDGYNILYPADISDELLRECAANDIYKLVLEDKPPKRADRFQLSDDGILCFCFGYAEDKPKELKAYNVFVSPQFFKRLVEANKKSNLASRMRIKVRTVRDPLFDTSSYERHRKQYGTIQVYDFPGRVRFQILLYPHSSNHNPHEWTIDLRRCKEPTDGSRFFY